MTTTSYALPDLCIYCPKQTERNEEYPRKEGCAPFKGGYEEAMKTEERLLGGKVVRQTFLSRP